MGLDGHDPALTAISDANDPRETREGLIPPGFSLGLHALRSGLIVSTIFAAAAWSARHASLRQWLVVPAFLVAGNIIEWAVHRYPMHRPLRPRILYRNHALVHHRAFDENTMAVRNSREFGLVLMPWYTMLLIFASAAPVAITAALAAGPPAAALFYMTASLHFAAYELLHASHHLPRGPWITSLRPLRALAAHHTHHHRLDRMAHVNFNVTPPLADFLFRTLEKPDRRAAADASASRM